MEIYSSTSHQAQTLADRPVYYSRNRLITGAVIWTVAALAFGAMAVRARDNLGGMAFFAAIAAIGVWLVIRCLMRAFGPAKPVITFTREGLRLTDGAVIPWHAINENTYVNQTYVGIPTARQIQLKTSLPDRKRVLVQAMALEISGDEYLALCDAYQAR
ncbi:MAG: hypothetical protein ACWGIK_19960 [Achromobacter pulmonis]|uniref:PH domain-containing protein n=1 Tax=Achromobacter pulmonis TaxID=1389932 RepID=A0A6S7CQJ5_9BURK|nr:hypothetical protein [Achromobacter pulmonis]MCF7768288.1 hypothetical protein [Achromobacter pulmonis]CAB3639817.1 hypothetical protein LMG26696_01979 [Achromobacter pulmonis]CAB3842201.1 hypothetical protein LMG26788_01310 [Achromobacter pulmonis]